MEKRTLCDGCGRMTPTIHGRCPSCWHVKHSAPATAKATSPGPGPRRREDGFVTRLGDSLLELLWFVPGVALLLIALLAADDGVLLVLGLVLLLGGGVGRFGDVFLP